MRRLYKPGASGWSPARTIESDELVAPARRGPSLLFAVSVIAGVSLATAGAVAMLFAEPSEGAAEAPVAKLEQPAPKPQKQADPAPAQVSADAKAVEHMTLQNLPFRKVATTQIKVSAAGDMLPERDSAPQPAQADLQGADALRQQDPRWARTEAPKASTIFASVLHMAPEADKPAAAEGGGPLSLAGQTPDTEQPADETQVAAIEPQPVKARAKPKAQEKPQPVEAAVEEPVEAPPGLSPARTAQVVKGANIRSRPKSGSSVLGVVPKGASVDLVGCKVWCEIVYKGKRGYVYKDFVAGAGGSPARKAAKTKTTFTVSTEEKPAEAAQPKAETTAEADTRFKVTSQRLQ